MTDTYHLHLFGGFELVSADGAPVRIASKKARALLAWLALGQDSPHSRNRLAHLLWSDSSDHHARHSLRQALSALRRAVPAISSHLVADSETVELMSGVIEVDALALEASIETLATVDHGEVMNRYRGEFLEGMNARSPAFDDWLMEKREHYRGLVSAVFEAAMNRAMSRGEMSEAIRIGIRLIPLDPLREDVHRLLMQCYASLGRIPDALQQYRICRTTLQNELNVAPSRETENLKIRLLSERSRSAPSRQAPAAAAPPKRPELRQVSLLRATPRIPAGSPDPVAEEQALAAVRKTCRQVAERLDIAPPLDDGNGAILVFGSPRTSSNDSLRALQAAVDIRAAIDAHVAVASGRAAIFPDVGENGEPVIQRLSGGVCRQLEIMSAFAADYDILVSDAVRLACIDHAMVDTPLDATLPGGIRIFPLETVDLKQPVRTLPGFIGRRMELRQIGMMLDLCREGGHGHVFMIRGEAGIGKSRLVRKAMDDAESKGDLCIEHHAGRANSGAAQNLILDCITAVIGDGRRDLPTPETVPRLRDAGVDDECLSFARVLLDDENSENRQAFFENTSAEERRTLGARLLTRLVTLLAETRPVVLVIEDIQWARTELLQQLTRIAALTTDERVTLVMTSRVEGDALNPSWRGAMLGAPMTTLDLQPLPFAKTRLLGERLAGSDHPRLEDCVARSAGNPLFLEQLLLAADYGDTLLPDTIQSIVEARLDALPAPERDATRALSVLGWQFSRAAMRHMLEGSGDLAENLMGRGLLVVAGDEGRFLHELVQRGVLDSMLPEERRAFHGRAAAFYRDRDPIQYARHAIDAEFDDAAGICLDTVTDHLSRYRFGAALDLAEHALRRGVRTPGLLEAKARGLVATGEAATAVTAYRESIDIQPSAAALIGCGEALIILDRYEEAAECLVRFDLLPESTRTVELLSKHEILRSRIAFAKGYLDACYRHGDQAVAYAKLANKAELEIESLSTVADAYYQQGQMDQAHDAFLKSHELADRQGLSAHAAVNLAMTAVVDFYRLDLSKAHTDALKAVQLAHQSGHRRHEAMAESIAAEICMMLGEFGAALSHARTAHALARTAGSIRFELEGGCTSGFIAHLMGESESGYRDMLHFARRMVEFRPAYSGPWLLAIAARCAPDAGSAGEVLAEGERILQEFSCVSHNYIHFYIHGIDRHLLDRNIEQARRYTRLLEDYLRGRHIPLGDHCVKRAHLLANWLATDDRSGAGVTDITALHRETRALGLDLLARTHEALDPRFGSRGADPG